SVEHNIGFASDPVPAAPTLALGATGGAVGDTVSLSGIHWNANAWFGSSTTPTNPGETPLTVELCTSALTVCTPAAADAAVAITRYQTSATNTTFPPPIGATFSGATLSGSFTIDDASGCLPDCVVRVSQARYNYPTGGTTGTSIVATTPLTPAPYHPLAPARLADTRPGSGQPDAGQTLAPAGTLNVQVTGAGGVPAGATAAVLNVTATNATAPSFFTVYPTGAGRPQASSLNFAAGATTPNLVEVGLGQNGQVSIFNHAGTADAIVDVEGYVAPGGEPAGRYNALSPARISDTRAGSGEPNAGQTLGPAGTIAVQVDGAGAVPPSGVSAVVLNVTATDTTASGFLTAYPDGTTRPLASNLNFTAGQTVPNRVIVPVGTDGKIDLYNHAGTTDAVVDVSGWYTNTTNQAAPGAEFLPSGPTRLADTRAGSGEPDTEQTLGAGQSITVPVSGTGGVPAGVTAVVLNVTVTDTTGRSYLTVYPTGQTRPLASDLNWVAGNTRANLAVVRPGPDGTITIYNNSSSTNVIVDVTGYYR
ncbi:MAG TPA: hypothetical protein VG184_02685, partial [Acidimicrobiales bacterium]|nr:hypothetical protein [Acidimicrobiales bacterium]